MAKPRTVSPKAKAAPSLKAKPKSVPKKSPLKAKRAAAAERGKQAVPHDRLQRLFDAVQAVREGRHDSPRTARLLAAGLPKMAQKVVEEAAEVAIEAVQGRREALVNESVDLLYNLSALWNGAGLGLDAIWAEMDRREAALGMAEKLPKVEEV